MGDQEYYYNAEYVTIYGFVKDEDDLVIVRNDHQELSVVERGRLVTKENSYPYRRAQERAEELKAITDEAEKDFDALVDKFLNDALSRLSSRMKMNIVFSGKGGELDSIGLSVAREIEKMMKESIPKTLKKGKK